MPTIAQVDIYRYALPLAQPLTFGGETIDTRSGLLLRLVDTEGREGVGDSAPLPHFSDESLEAAEQAARALQDMLPGQTLPDGPATVDRWLRATTGTEDWPASVQCGIDGAIWSLLAAARGITISDLLSPRARTTVTLNALVTDAAEPAQAARQLQEEGYRALKLKVGRHALEADIRRVSAVLDVLDNAAVLRLDANRAWSWAEAVTAARRLSWEQIEYIEEPLADPSQLADLAQTYDVPVALDEATRSLTLNELDDHAYAQAVILKPTLLGGLAQAWRWARRAHRLGLVPVVSSSFESGIGLRGLVALAAAFPVATPMGLGTYRYLHRDVGTQRLPFHPPTLDVPALLQAPCRWDPAVVRSVSTSLADE